MLAACYYSLRPSPLFKYCRISNAEAINHWMKEETVGFVTVVSRLCGQVFYHTYSKSHLNPMSNQLCLLLVTCCLLLRGGRTNRPKHCSHFLSIVLPHLSSVTPDSFSSSV
jgi:hypothetical protein